MQAIKARCFSPLLCLISSMFLVSCGALNPELFKAVDDVLTDDCVTIKVDRDAFHGDPDFHAVIDVTHKAPAK